MQTHLPLTTDPAGQGPRSGPRRGSVSSQLHEALRRRILTLDLLPGKNISRSEIASEYGVSLTPVRDALLKLEEEGLVATFPQSKTEVSKIDIHHAQVTHFLRLSVELEIVRRLCDAATPGMLDRARAYLRQQIAARDAGDLRAFGQFDRLYHLSLYEAAGVESLYLLIDARSGHIDRLRELNLPDPGKTHSILDCHGRLLDAIGKADAETACEVLREHLSGTLALADAIRERHPEYF